VTLAEARLGYLNAEWGAARIAEEDRRLGSFLQMRRGGDEHRQSCSPASTAR
jgi:hypothetical protein